MEPPSGKRRAFGVAVLAVLALAAAGCATQLRIHSYDPPGFFSGFFHGLTIVFALIAELFTEYRVYAVPNSGGFYDLGYVLGASTALGGGAAAAR